MSAADWIKWTKGLAARREVVILATKFGRDRHEIAGRLMSLWEWCDDNFTDDDVSADFDVSLILGDQPFAFVDALLGLPGLAEAMASPEVKWLDTRSGGRLVFPNLARHNGTSAKTRAEEAKKKQRQRKRAKKSKSIPADSPEMSPDSGDTNGDKSRTREEKRRNKDISHTPRDGPPGNVDAGFLTGQSPAFRRFWEAYPRQNSPGEAWRVWQGVIAELVGQRGMTDAVAEEFLIERAELYAQSPAGLPPPPGDPDYRPAPAKWLRDSKFDEPYSEWQKPNRKGNQHGDSHRRGTAGSRKRTPAAEAVQPRDDAEDFDALFDRVTQGSAGGVAQIAADAVPEPG